MLSVLSKSLSWASAHAAMILFYLVLVASIATALTPVRFRHAKWYGWLVRTGDRLSVLTHPDALGTLKLPGLASAISPELAAALQVAQAVASRGNAGVAHVRPMAFLALFVAIAFVVAPMSLAIHGCAGSTTTIGATGTVSTAPGGDVNWTVGVNIGIHVAQAVLPTAQAALDSSPAISPSARTSIDLGFHAAIDALPLASTALDTYVHAPSAGALCRGHFYVQPAITGALQGMTLARDVGATIDPMATAAVGSLGAVADMLFASCSSGAPARHITAQERIRNALGPRASAMLSIGETRVFFASAFGFDPASAL